MRCGTWGRRRGSRSNAAPRGRLGQAASGDALGGRRSDARIRKVHPLHGVPSGRFPRFIGTVRGSDFLPPFPPRFVSFARRLPASLRCSLSRGSSSPSASQGVYGSPIRSPLETAGSPRFLGVPLYVRCVLRPRPDLGASHDGAPVLRPSQVKTSAPAISSFRGSITRLPHSLCTLRSRGHPRTTQHSVPAGCWPLPGRVTSCWDPLKVSIGYMTSSFSRLAWRTTR